MARITIIGGGISGLTLAYWLHKAGRDVVVLESGSEPGGTMKTVRDGDWLIETGPNSALATTPLFDAIAQDLGLTPYMCRANRRAKKRYILRNGTLHALPSSPISFIQSNLWSARGKLRLLKEPFISRGQGEETLASFVRRRIGQEFLDYAVNPFVAGVFAGDPEKLSVADAFPKLYNLEKNYRSLILGAIRSPKKKADDGTVAKNRAEMFSFHGGMQTLPQALHTCLGARVRCLCNVHSIQKKENGFSLGVAIAEQMTTMETDILVTAVPAYKASPWFQTFDPGAAQALKNIPYAPAAEVFLGYDEKAVRHTLDGFGFLIPEKEKRRILGAIWTTSIFENRAPKEHVAFTIFIGGARQPELVSGTNEALVRIATDELGAIMAIRDLPVYSRVTRWEHAIPQYTLGHSARMAALTASEVQHPGLFFAGNYRGGISVGDCLMHSHQLAQKILNTTSMKS